VFTRAVKLEGSWFNGREPDENRTNLDYAGRRLDSYGTRLTVNPGPRWSVSSWYAYLKSPEGLHPEESLHRYGVAALTTQPYGRSGQWASALILGANDQIGSGQASNGVVLESNLDLDETNAVFGRVEYVQKSAQDLGIASVSPTVPIRRRRSGARLPAHGWDPYRLAAGVGVRGSVNFVPSSLEAQYGSRTPVGLAVYMQLRPAGAR